MQDILPILISGISQGVPLFLIASGLTLIFGVMHVLNFAHGSFFMIAAFIFTTQFTNTSMIEFVMVVVLAGIVIAAIGFACEAFVFRRLYGSGSQITLLAAFALFLVLEGGARAQWGGNPRSAPYPDGLRGSVELFGARIGIYDLTLIGIGSVVAIGLWFLIQRTQFGRQLRAVAQDRTMAMILGVRSKRIASLVFILGAFLAGVAGALSAPQVSIDVGLAASFLIPAFVVIIVGGVGSIGGALVAALALSITESALFTYVPWLTGFSFYLAVAAILMVRPQGLFGGHLVTAGRAR